MRKNKKILIIPNELQGFFFVESVETSPGFFYCTGNHSVPENPLTEWSQIWNRPLFLIIQTPFSVS